MASYKECECGKDITYPTGWVGDGPDPCEEVCKGYCLTCCGHEVVTVNLTRIQLEQVTQIVEREYYTRDKAYRVAGKSMPEDRKTSWLQLIDLLLKKGVNNV